MRRRNPIFSPLTGITIQACLVPDWMHCLSLGVFQWFISATMHELFEVNAFRAAQPVGGQEAVVRNSLIQFRAELFVWYSAETKAGRSPNTVQDFTYSMYHGPGTDMGLHAAETNTLLEFVVTSVLPKYGNRLNCISCVILKRVGSALVAILHLIRGNRWKLSDVQTEVPRFCFFLFWGGGGSALGGFAAPLRAFGEAQLGCGPSRKELATPFSGPLPAHPFLVKKLCRRSKNTSRR